MEIDISEKVNRLLKYGIGILIVTTICVAAAVWQKSGTQLMVHDAQIAGTLVNTPAKTAGTIIEILVEEGTIVEAGQPLAKMKVAITPEQLEQMKKAVETGKARYNELLTRPSANIAPTGGTSADLGASVQRAQEDFNRAAAAKEKLDKLFAIGGISAVQHNQAVAVYEAARHAYDAAQAMPTGTVNATPPEDKAAMLKIADLQLKQAEAALAAALKNVQSAEIIAPVGGTVYFNGIQLGDAVTPGQTVFRVGNLEEIWVEAPIALAQKNSIQLGQFVEYTLVDYPGRTFTGTVYDIVDVVDAARASEGAALTNADAAGVVIRISLPANLDIEVKPGMKAAAKISV